jgi:hypothetical protein
MLAEKKAKLADANIPKIPINFSILPFLFYRANAESSLFIVMTIFYFHMI